MGLRLAGQEHGNCFFVTTTFRDWDKLGQMDGFYQRLSESLIFCCEKFRARMSGYVLMPDHVHLLLFIDGSRLGSFMRDFKKYAAQKIAPDLSLDARGIWMSRYDWVALYSEDVFRTRLNYIHQNPVKAGFADNAEDWEWSSAADYLTDRSGPIPVWGDWL